jgi:hypothetical protein
LVGYISPSNSILFINILLQASPEEDSVRLGLPRFD